MLAITIQQICTKYLLFSRHSAKQKQETISPQGTHNLELLTVLKYRWFYSLYLLIKISCNPNALNQRLLQEKEILFRSSVTSLHHCTLSEISLYRKVNSLHLIKQSATTLGLNLIPEQILFPIYQVQAQNTFSLHIQVRSNCPGLFHSLT